MIYIRCYVTATVADAAVCFFVVVYRSRSLEGSDTGRECLEQVRDAPRGKLAVQMSLKPPLHQ